MFFGAMGSHEVQNHADSVQKHMINCKFSLGTNASSKQQVADLRGLLFHTGNSWPITTMLFQLQNSINDDVNNDTNNKS